MKQNFHVVYPLHAAARHGHIDCLQILCQSGFDINYVTDEGSALHVAALFGKVQAVKLLLEKGNSNSSENLHLIFCLVFFDILGINTDLRDCQGRTVLETLYEHENQKASDLTQVIQSREGWLECRKIIQGFLFFVTRKIYFSSCFLKKYQFIV